jgi:NhaP-type Na+/H+ or K+/H+ antiporter
MKGFLIKLPILSAIAVIVVQVFFRKGEQFAIMSIPFALAGYLVGWLLRWVLIHIMGATTSDWRDKLFSILLPFIGAAVGAIAGSSF